ncbi:acylamino-acid-releasing enzyme-like isoform X1 [Vanessa atalanta]|uniref:acylamino-acid-releasing enzyme-like isoform X1 n=1 Tax=Vanessa atalanta TaxID=42275 RepID=UPI001FCD0584|nr:acylamino-acid-releasing enzyme-like isoform X1 [Vanessa atalanta]XP_047529616.1 acylamino-acid-releasing enzyme-like isoform X1 [Vanessa atalanta]
MGEIWKMGSHMESVIKAYKTLSKIPSIVGGKLNSQGNRVTSRWSIRNLDRGKHTQYMIDYFLDTNLKVLSDSEFAVDVSHEMLTAVSPKENYRAVIREEKEDKEYSQRKLFLEVWTKTTLKHSVDLTSLDIHGDVYADSENGCLEWSSDEKHICYIAEKKIKKSEPFIKRKPVDDKTKDPDEKMADDKHKEFEKKPTLTPGEEHIYREDWGEQMMGKYQTVVVLFRIADETFSILENIPDNLCPGQVRFTPNGDALVGVAWDISGVRRLGLIYCTNRPGYIFCYTLTGKLKKLSEENKAVRSPRFSPNGDLVWLQREAGGPHHACHQLVRMSANTINSVIESDDYDVCDDISVVIDIVHNSKDICDEETFYGIYCQSLPTKCFSSDGKRLIFSTQQQNEIRSYVVDIESGDITDISNNKEDPGSTSVLCVQADVILASWSNMTTPGQLFAAKLPAAGQERDISWVRVSAPPATPPTPGTIVQYLSLRYNHEDDAVASFGALYGGRAAGAACPLVVWPHGGPHSAFCNAYSLEAAFFNALGFACLLINYRGSTGTGDASVFFLPSRIGTADVADCKLATEKAIELFPINEEKLLLYGGSHGGFLVAHLSGLYSGFYSVTVARNPVIDLASMYNTSDIADWCSVEAGFPFTDDGPKTEDHLLALRRVSPIVHAHKVTTPTAIMLGTKDKRVPYYQGLEYSRMLRANGVNTKVFMYEDNHSLSSLPVEMDNLINAADWFISMIKDK